MFQGSCDGNVLDSKQGIASEGICAAECFERTETPLCSFYTYHSSGDCFFFDTCVNLAVCPDECVSGVAPDCVCFAPGFCSGGANIIIEPAPDPNSCLQSCIDNTPNCVLFNYDTVNDVCEQTGGCTQILPYNDWVTGSASCSLDGTIRE